jgi:enterochelin esterase-like enzyme
MSRVLYNELPGVEYSRDQHLSQSEALKNSHPKLYWTGMEKEDFLYRHIPKLLEIYDQVGLEYLCKETAGHHDWNSWRPYLTALVTLLFNDSLPARNASYSPLRF